MAEAGKTTLEDEEARNPTAEEVVKHSAEEDARKKQEVRSSDTETLQDAAEEESPEQQSAAASSSKEEEREHKASAAPSSARRRTNSPLLRSRAKNPVKRLTHKLLDTYQDINEKYYAKHNGRDDEHGDYIIKAGDIVNERYVITKRPNGSSPLLGSGSFGKVVYALDKKSAHKEVALKIIKNHRHWHQQAKCEIELLKRFTQMAPVPHHGDWVEHANVVRLVDDFEFHGHCCLVFELLPFTLYDLLKISKFRGVSLVLVSRIAQHLLRTLECLRHPDVDVIHCDLKPENLMLVKNDDHRVKVIDFGSSCSSKRQPFTYIQSRFYRSPEVLLCRPYSHAIDMWSLGCILAELHTGRPLFNGKDEEEQMCKVVQVRGVPPRHMIAGAGAKARVKHLFAEQDGQYKLTTRKVEAGSRELKSIIRRPAGPHMMTREQERHYEQFEDLLCQMLALDPDCRILPKHALAHPFLSHAAEESLPPSPSPPPPAADLMEKSVGGLSLGDDG